MRKDFKIFTTFKENGKIENDGSYIPKFNESEYLLRYNYNVQQLKVFAKNTD